MDRFSPTTGREQRLCVFQIGGVEALGEPAVDLGEHCAGLVAATWFASSRARLVVARSSAILALWRPGDFDRGAEALLRWGTARRVLRQQQLTFDVMQRRSCWPAPRSSRR